MSDPGVAGSVVVVTGAASGIGRALAERFAADGARAVVILDRDATAAAAVADTLSSPASLGLGVDVTDEAALREAVVRIETDLGPIDVWCSNAGIATAEGLGDDDDWDRAWRVHVLAHVYAARHVLPGMADRGRGRFVITASAAGLLTEMDSAPYPVTKHAAVALAEWLAIRYGDHGVGLHCLCPQAVRTPMTAGFGPESATLAAGAMLEPEQVAQATAQALAEGRFLILPHPEVAEFERRRSTDRDRWLAGMRRVRSALLSRRTAPPEED
ncbi:MAG TPA: SDR family oxidoreductase [Micromonosporaceae bacterium]